VIEKCKREENEKVSVAELLRNWPKTKGDMEKVFEVITKGIPNSAVIGWSQLSEREWWG
jgi:hypothetical protein